MRSQLKHPGLVACVAALAAMMTGAPVLAQAMSPPPTGGSSTTAGNQDGRSLIPTVGPTTAEGRSKTQFLIVKDPAYSMKAVSEHLVEAGLAELQTIGRLPPRFSQYRMITVPAANAQTKAKLLGIEGVQTVRPVFRGGSDGSPALPTGQVIVNVRSADAASRINQIAGKYNCTVVRNLGVLNCTYVLALRDESQTDAYDVARQIAGEAGVGYVQPSLLFKLEKHQFANEIADPYYSFQWHLNNTGQWENSVRDADIDAPEAWTLTMGEGAIVGVVDDSVQAIHEDLSDNYITGYDFRDGDDDPNPSFGPYWPDAHGDAHGTAVSGLICARANDIGTRGVAPEAGLIGIRLGADLWVTDLDVAEAFLFCESNGAMAINNSWGGPGFPWYLFVFNSEWISLGVIGEALDYVATEGRDGLGVLVLFSAGNDTMDIRNGNVYAAHDRVMAIGATLRDDRLTCYSNFGPNQSVVAPGGGAYWVPGCYEADMTTTDVTATGAVDFWSEEPIIGYNPPRRWFWTWWDLLYDEELDIIWIWPTLIEDDSVSELPNYNYTRQFNGTSASCPVATGMAALVFSVNPGYTSYQVRNIMEHTADKVLTEGAYDGVTGHNKYMGHGRLNAYRAVLAAYNFESWPNPVDLLGTGQLGNIVHLEWQLPDWNKDGEPDDDAVGVLVVQGPRHQLNWQPTDGEVYGVGQEVAPGIFVVANDYINYYQVQDIPSANYDYAVFVRNDMNYYSWGRRAPLEGEAVEPAPDEDLRASIIATPRTGSAPLTVRFTGGGVDSQGGQFLLFNWDFGDGTTGSGPLVTHTYDSVGTYMVRLTATTSNAGTARASAQITVIPEGGENPNVRIVATPESGAAPLIVLFQANVIDFDGVIARYEWDFGDGSTATGAVTEHVYIDPGLYVVMLTVIDSQGGKSAATKVLRVTSGAGSTAGATVPESALDARNLMPVNCGGGAAGALLTGLAFMLGAVTVRRRWF